MNLGEFGEVNVYEYGKLYVSENDFEVIMEGIEIMNGRIQPISYGISQKVLSKPDKETQKLVREWISGKELVGDKKAIEKIKRYAGL